MGDVFVWFIMTKTRGRERKLKFIGEIEGFPIFPFMVLSHSRRETEEMGNLLVNLSTRQSRVVTQSPSVCESPVTIRRGEVW